MQQSIPRPEYPRPDFMRTQWESLNGTWAFSFDEPVFDREILVPFCYQAQASGIGITEDHRMVWYRRQVALQEDVYRGHRVLLNFGAVDTEATVWINGLLAGSHVGGHTSFTLDITELVHDGENEITVRAVDDTNADKPRGKQSWTGEKFGCWYTPTTGIWQSVWIEYAGTVYVKRVKLTPRVKDLSALCEIFLEEYAQAGAPEEIEVQVTARLRELPLGTQTVICRHGYGKGFLTFPDWDIRRDELLWSPEKPNLITVTVEIAGTVVQDATADVVQTYFGLRETGCKNGVLTLNQAPYYQRLVLDQGYWPETILTPPSDEAIRADILLTKQMGFNGARKHQKIEDPRYYYWADQLGLLVWGELPSAYEFNDRAILASSHELEEFIQRDYNHPCIVNWVPVNESWGVRNIQNHLQQQNYCRMLTYLIKAMDPVRTVSANDGWEQVGDTDICAIHDYALFPSSIHKYDDMEKLCNTVAESRELFADGSSYTGQPVVLTEYGGIAFEQPGETGWGYYGKVRNSQEFIDRLEPITTFLITSGKFSGYCYTQLTDVMQEVNGLLHEDRTPKVAVEELQKIFGRARY